jgi:hypothetical protein
MSSDSYQLAGQASKLDRLRVPLCVLSFSAAPNRRGSREKANLPSAERNSFFSSSKRSTGVVGSASC